MTDNANRLVLTSENLKSIHAVWRELAAGSLGPNRDAITPAQLRAKTASTFFIDVVDGGKDFRFRFAGDRVIQFMGRRLAGEMLSAHRGTPFFDGMHGLYARCLASRAPVTSGPMPARYPGKEFLEIEVLVMPLSDDGETVTSLFGAFDSRRLGGS
jgi:hypothetical protein